MNECAFPIGITALAAAIAKEIPDNNTLTMISVVLVQIGDTLATIVAQRTLCEERAENQKEKQEEANA